MALRPYAARYARPLSLFLVGLAFVLALWGLGVALGWVNRPDANVLLFGALAAFFLAHLVPVP